MQTLTTANLLCLLVRQQSFSYIKLQKVADHKEPMMCVACLALPANLNPPAASPCSLFLKAARRWVPLQRDTHAILPSLIRTSLAVGVLMVDLHQHSGMMQGK